MERNSESRDHDKRGKEMKGKVYVSNDNKPIRGDIHGVRDIEKTPNGMILTFSNRDNAYRVAQILMNSGYETVKVL